MHDVFFRVWIFVTQATHSSFFFFKKFENNTLNFQKNLKTKPHQTRPNPLDASDQTFSYG
jgi:hypothetical protein